MNFYQSDLRKTISQDIYKKSLFSVSIEDKEYRGIAKFMERHGIKTARYMVHGVDASNTETFSQELKEHIARLKRDMRHHWWDIFFQIWLTNILDERPTHELKIPAIKEEISKKHTYQASDFLQRYNLRPSRRQHMPEATILLDLTLTDEKRKEQLSSSGKRYLNKADKQDFSFQLATTPEEREAFYRMRYTTSYDKHFHIISLETYMQLMTYLTETKQWALFISKKNDAIVSGSVCLFFEKELIYLYGATNRQWGDIGGHYWLTMEIAQRGHEQKYAILDLLGTSAPRDHEQHSLQGVTRFKQAFGGITRTYVGNYDIIFNTPLYNTFKWRKKK